MIRSLALPIAAAGSPKLAATLHALPPVGGEDGYRKLTRLLVPGASLVAVWSMISAVAPAKVSARRRAASLGSASLMFVRRYQPSRWTYVSTRAMPFLWSG